MRRIKIRLFGPFEVTIDDAPVTAFEYAKVRALLAYLALEERGPILRSELATLLWPDQPERSARANLSQALTTLRNAFGDKGAAAPVILADTQSVQLNPDCDLEADVTRFLALQKESASHAHHSWRTCALCAARLQQAIDLYRGDFLADVAIADSEVFEEWLTLQREHLMQRALSTLERLVERAQWRNEYAVALAYARWLVNLEPLIEANQRTYMQLLALNGETAAALAHFRRFQDMLARELDAEPEHITIDLFNQIRRGNLSALPSSAPPFVVPNIPTPLVGRDAELQMICGYVRQPDIRAITVTGTGGIGKTRLAIEAAHALRYDFEHGIYMVELASVSDTAQVAGAIAQTLGVKERPQQPLSETLQTHLRTKQALLLLDNFEHVLGAVSLVSALLAACSGITILVAVAAADQIIPLAGKDGVLIKTANDRKVDDAGFKRTRINAVGAAERVEGHLIASNIRRR